MRGRQPKRGPQVEMTEVVFLRRQAAAALEGAADVLKTPGATSDRTVRVWVQR